MNSKPVWYVKIDGEQRGPFHEEELAQQIVSGAIGEGVQISQSRTDEWRSIREVDVFDGLIASQSECPPGLEKSSLKSEIHRENDFGVRGRLEEKPADSSGAAKHVADTLSVMNGSGGTEHKVPRRYRRGLAGIVRDLQIGESKPDYPEQISSDYLTFRLERLDQNGSVLENVPIEFFSRRIRGKILREGAEVVVLGRRNRHGIVRPKSIYVIETQSEVRSNTMIPRGPLEAVGKLGSELGKSLLHTTAALIGMPLTLVGFFGFFAGGFMILTGNDEGVGIIVGSILALTVGTVLGKFARGDYDG